MRGEINGHTIFLSEDQRPVVSLTLNDLMDPSKIRGAKTNTLRVIATKEGRQELGGEFMSEVDLLPGGFPTLKIGEDSVALFEGRVAPLSRSRNEIECLGLGGNSQWFEFAKKTKLNEYEYGDTEVVDAARQVNSWTDAQQFDYWPLVNFGGITDFDETDNITSTYIRPALRVHHLLGDPLLNEGFTLRPRGTLTNLWDKLVVLTPKAKLSTSAVNDETGYVRDDLSTGIFPVAEIGDPPTLYPITLTDPGGNLSFGEWTQPFLGSLRVQVNNLRIALDALSGNVVGKRLRLVLYNTATNAVVKGYISDTVQASQGDVVFNVLWNIPSVIAGTDLHLGLQIDDATGIVSGDISTGPDFNDFCVEFIPYREEDPLEREAWVMGRRLWLASAAPSMTLADLFSALCLNLCLIVDTHQDGTIDVWYDKEFFRKPAQGVAWRDWTSRMDHSKAPEKHVNENPIRINYKWKEDNNDFTLADIKLRNSGRGFGDGTVEFAQGVAKEVDRTMPLAATINGSAAINNAPIPNLVNEEEEDSHDFEPRLLIAEGMIEYNWTFNSDFLTEGPLCYFERYQAAFPALSFEGSFPYAGNKASGVLDHLHLTRHRRMALPYLEASMEVWDHEIPDFDHGRPTLADDGSGPAWYYVQEIKNHRLMDNARTRCILVPLPVREILGEIVNPAITYPEQPEDDLCFGLDVFPDTLDVDRVVLAQDQAALEAEFAGGGFQVSGASGAGANTVDAPYVQIADISGRAAYSNGTWTSQWTGTDWVLTDGAVFYFNVDNSAMNAWDTAYIVFTAPGPNPPVITNAAATLNLNDTLLIRDHNTVSPGSTLFEIHTGDIATAVTPGTGEAGSMWSFTTPATSAIIKDLANPTEYWKRGFELTTTIYTDNGGTGALAVEYFYPPQEPGGVPPVNIAIDPHSYETDVRVTFSGATADACRIGILEFSTDGGSTWDDHSQGTFLDWSGNPPAAVGCDYDTDATHLRIRWERSGQVQGYSQPIAV